MPDITSSLYNLRLLDDLAQKDTRIHRIHPLAQLLTTMVFITVVISFGHHEISSLLPLLLYPVLIFSLAEIPVLPLLKRLLVVSPLIIGIGIFNPFFDHQTIRIGQMVLSRGWLTFLSLCLKGGLTVTAALLLIATSGIENLAAALRQLKVPKVFALQLLLTYRYISVLTEEMARMLRAYALRAPGQRGIRWHTWGSFAGQLLLRTYDRAQWVYEAMSLRGFDGEYHTGNSRKLAARDWLYMVLWVTFFIVVKVYPVPTLIGLWLMEVIR